MNAGQTRRQRRGIVGDDEVVPLDEQREIGTSVMRQPTVLVDHEKPAGDCAIVRRGAWFHDASSTSTASARRRNDAIRSAISRAECSGRLSEAGSASGTAS